jgi:formamidase
MGRTLEGPVLFPLIEDLPHLAKPLDETETKKARHLAAKWGIAKVEESAPISIVGSGPNLNSATEVGLRQAAQLLSMTIPEVMNRATITGGIEIGRHPGAVQITFLAPLAALESAGLMSFVQEQYGIG